MELVTVRAQGENLGELKMVFFLGSSYISLVARLFITIVHEWWGHRATLQQYFFFPCRLLAGCLWPHGNKYQEPPKKPHFGVASGAAGRVSALEQPKRKQRRTTQPGVQQEGKEREKNGILVSVSLHRIAERPGVDGDHHAERGEWVHGGQRLSRCTRARCRCPTWHTRGNCAYASVA